MSEPGQAFWATLRHCCRRLRALGRLFGYTVSPVVRRAVEVVEYLALAAVVPLACWVVGLYGLVRD